VTSSLNAFNVNIVVNTVVNSREPECVNRVVAQISFWSRPRYGDIYIYIYDPGQKREPLPGFHSLTFGHKREPFLLNQRSILIKKLF